VIWGNKWKFTPCGGFPLFHYLVWFLKLGKKLEMCLKEVKRRESLDACVIYEIENLSIDVQHFVHCSFFFFLHEVK
jgi:hypothetical protein